MGTHFVRTRGGGAARRSARLDIDTCKKLNTLHTCSMYRTYYVNKYRYSQYNGSWLVDNETIFRQIVYFQFHKNLGHRLYWFANM